MTLTDVARRHSSTPSDRPDQTADRLAQAIAQVIRSWRLIAGASLSIGVATALLVLALPERYESQFSFVPQAAASLATARPSLLGLAQGLGLSSIASALGGNSTSDYYTSLLSSRSLAERVLLHPFAPGTHPRHPEATNLLIVLGADPDHFNRSLDRGVQAFGKMVIATSDPLSQVVSVSVDLDGPILAHRVADIVLEELNHLNAEINHRLAVAQLEFVTQQLRETKAALYTAEDNVKKFQMTNRTIATPALVFEQGRLTRQLNLAETLYQSLAQQYQQSRLDAVKDLPSFAVLDRPNEPALRAFPKRTVAVTLAVVLVGIVAAGTVFLSALLPSARDPDSDPLGTVKAALASAGADILSVYRRLVGRDR